MNSPVEPSADLRSAAKGLFQVFVALKNEGFTEQQALVILGQMLAMNKGQGE